MDDTQRQLDEDVSRRLAEYLAAGAARDEAIDRFQKAEAAHNAAHHAAETYRAEQAAADIETAEQ